MVVGSIPLVMLIADMTSIYLRDVHAANFQVYVIVVLLYVGDR